MGTVIHGDKYGNPFCGLDIDEMKDRFDAAILLSGGCDEDQAHEIMHKIYWDLHYFLGMKENPEAVEPKPEPEPNIVDEVMECLDRKHNKQEYEFIPPNDMEEVIENGRKAREEIKSWGSDTTPMSHFVKKPNRLVDSEILKRDNKNAKI